MGRFYTIPFDNLSVTIANGTHDLASILPGSGKKVRLHSIKLDNVGDETGDTNEKMLRINVIRGHTTAPSGGTSLSAATTLDPDDPADGATLRYGDTTLATAGTSVTLAAFGWNVRVPFREVLTPGEWVYAKNAEWLVVRLAAAVTADMNMSGTITFEEI